MQRSRRRGPGLAQPIDECRDEVASVLALHGHQAGQYHVLGPDPWDVVWTADRAGFAAVLRGRHCLLMWRSPVAPPGRRAELLDLVLEHAARTRLPLFALLVDDEVCTAGIQAGMAPIWIGTEAILDLAGWSLSGGKRQKVRWARSHAVKLGLCWREARPLTDADDREALARVEHVWKAVRPERRTDSFQRTSFMELAEVRRYFVCEDDDGIVAFTACTPMNGRAWYLQDVVRLPDAPRGALEGAMALALDTFRDEGFECASNGPLPFWRPDGHEPDTHQLGPIGSRVVHFFDRQYRFRGLGQFRSKFEPDHTVPLYILRSRRIVTPGAARSLTRLMTDRLE